MIGIGHIFRLKCRDLAVGEGGSALALTLAFLLPVYLLVLAIYGVSETVRRKIELQNAADAAAYSAATVQADYLSRIAVLNKAVAWSYADMTRRQLDYGMGHFTSQTIKYFNEDFERAKTENTPCHMHQLGVNWSAGWSPEAIKGVMKAVTLRLGTGVGVPRLLERFNEQSIPNRMMELIELKFGIEEVTGKGVLVNSLKIEKHALRLTECRMKLKSYIGFGGDGEMKKEIEKAANDMLDLNTREIDGEVLRYVRVGNPERYLSPLRNDEDGERRLLQHALTFDKDDDYDQSKFFGPGIGRWFKRTKTSRGIFRGYHQYGKKGSGERGEYLHAEWSYFWTKWRHVQLLEISLHLPPVTRNRYDLVNRSYDATDSRYNGFKEGGSLGAVGPAVAYVLNEPASGSGAVLGTLFGKEGTIVVGLARENPNPLRLFGTKGLVTAFDPAPIAGDNPRPDYIWAVSAARAAYNDRTADYRKADEVKSKLKDPSYRIDYTEPTKRKDLWNLREADWDAMFVPVRYANASAMSGFFSPVGRGVLDEVMKDKSGWKKKDGDKWVSAGVDWTDLKTPGGFADCGGSGTLKWSDLDRYLYH